MNTSGSSETEQLDSSGFANMNSSSIHKYSIGRILLDMGKITPIEAEHILLFQKESGLRFGEAALKLGLVTEGDIQQVSTLWKSDRGFSSYSKPVGITVVCYRP